MSLARRILTSSLACSVPLAPPYQRLLPPTTRSPRSRWRATASATGRCWHWRRRCQAVRARRAAPRTAARRRRQRRARRWRRRYVFMINLTSPACAATNGYFSHGRHYSVLPRPPPPYIFIVVLFCIPAYGGHHRRCWPPVHIACCLPGTDRLRRGMPHGVRRRVAALSRAAPPPCQTSWIGKTVRARACAGAARACAAPPLPAPRLCPLPHQLSE